MSTITVNICYQKLPLNVRRLNTENALPSSTSGFRKSVVLWEAHLTSPACPSGKNKMYIKVTVGQYCSDTKIVKRQHLENSLYQWHSYYHKSPVGRSDIERDPPRWEAGDWPPEFIARLFQSIVDLQYVWSFMSYLRGAFNNLSTWVRKKQLITKKIFFYFSM